jgi:hypothetical protein
LLGVLGVGLITITRMGGCYADSGADTCDQTQQTSQHAGAPIPALHNCIPRTPKHMSGSVCSDQACVSSISAELWRIVF